MADRPKIEWSEFDKDIDPKMGIGLKAESGAEVRERIGLKAEIEGGFPSWGIVESLGLKWGWRVWDRPANTVDDQPADQGQYDTAWEAAEALAAVLWKRWSAWDQRRRLNVELDRAARAQLAELKRMLGL